MTQHEFDEAVNRITQRLETVEHKYIRKVAKQIKQIGELNQSSINRLTVMLEMNKDIAEIVNDLLTATGLNIADMQAIYERAAEDVYTDERFKGAIEALENTPESSQTAAKTPKGVNGRLMQYTRSVARQTAGTMANLSNTTIVSQTYRDAIDNAIIAASTGMGSYQEEMRSVVEDLGRNGIQVRYPSGYKRRLDTAVRQNIIDGVKQIAQQGSLLMGEELGYDAVEISAHLRSAPDHEPVQGRIFKLAEFEKMQSGEEFCDVNGKPYDAFKRPIGKWNCQHIVMSFSTKWSVPRYNEEQLQRWAEDNSEGCFIGGKHYTIYEATQLMRKLETKSRWLKNEAIAAQAAGDEELRRDLQRKINQVSEQYAAVAAASEQPMKKNRMQVSGFRAVKAASKNESGISGKHITRTGENTVDKEYIASQEFKDKFKGITGNSRVDQQIYSQAKAQLVHRDGTYGEDLALINGFTGSVEGNQFNSKTDTGVDYNKSLNQAISSNPPYTLISIHNHPTNNPPTGSDLVSNATHKYKLGVVVTHNGRVFTYKAGEKPFLATSFGNVVDKNRSKGYNEYDAIIETLKQYQRDYGIEWSER